MRYWLVEMNNLTDSRDDEVWKVRATSAVAAIRKASEEDPRRFVPKRAVRARGGTVYDRAFAKELRTYCTRTL